MGGLVAAYKKRPVKQPVFDGIQVSIGYSSVQVPSNHEQTKRQADQPADNLAGSLPFSAPCSISNERSVFAMCILRFVFLSASIAARFY